MWSQQQDLNFESLYKAWLQCQRRKAGKSPAQRYELNALENLFDTLQQLQQGTYQTSISYSFVIQKPKLREIHAAQFKDRVVHHLLVPQLEAIWEPIFIYDVYSNRKYKGTHKAVKRLQKWMRKADAKYFMQLDIKNFFYSVQQDLLIELIKKGLNKATKQQKITKEKAHFLLWLSHIFITANYQNATELDKKLSAKVPKHKQLQQQPKGQGLPIGNLTSQFFANVYMNELDQYIKHHLKAKYYLRYADDFILLANTQKQLEQWQQQISFLLNTQLKLSLKEIVQPKQINIGADFLGFIIRPYYVLVRKRVINNLTEKLQWFEKQISPKSSLRKRRVTENKEANANAKVTGSHCTIFFLKKKGLDGDLIVEQLRSTLASYLGHFKYANSLKLIKSIWKKHPWLNELYNFNFKSWKLEIKYQPPKHYNFKQQILFFREQYPNAYLKIQKGRQTITFIPMVTNVNRVIKKMIIKQVGYNQVGI